MSRMRVAAAIAAAILMGAAAEKPPAAPYWAHHPTPAQEEAAWAAAGKGAAGGRAAMVCKAQADGALSGCEVTLERPTGAGLGKAILALAPEFRVNMSAPHPPAVGSDIVIPLGDFKFDKSGDWLRKPTGDDVMQVWPTQAWAHARGGKGIINCLVSLQGALYDCGVIYETPPGEHFGDAALALSPQFLMKPAILNGQPVVSSVSVPVNFYLPPGTPAPGPSRGALVVQATMAWPEAPSYAAVAAAYPSKARAAKLGGRATLNCEFDKQGRLGSCDTIAEEPKHQGFADAARTLAKQFRAFPKMADGKSVSGAGIELPVVFDPAMLSGDDPVVGKAQWATLPSSEDTSAAFGKLGLSGTNRAMLACVVQQGGAVSDCRVVSEDPVGKGLAAAALSLASHFRLTTWTAEGLPTVGATVNIPLRYEARTAEPKG